MKRIVCILLIYSVVFILGGCGNSIDKSEENKRDEEFYKIAHKFTRARIRKDNKSIKEFISSIIDNKAGKEKYSDKISSINKYNIRSYGVEFIEYTIMNTGERKKVIDLLEKEYGLDEDYVEELEDVGYVSFDIKYRDNKGKVGIIKDRNIGFKYQNEYFMFLYNENKKGE